MVCHKIMATSFFGNMMKKCIIIFAILLSLLLCSGIVSSEIPNDPKYLYEQPLLKKIDSESAWDVTTGSNEVIVGIVDTGIDYTHPDLAGNLWNENGNYGYTVYNDLDDTMDIAGHGTMCAGIIGAVGNNAEGIAGTAWNIKQLMVKTNRGDSESLYNTMDGVKKAISLGCASIISMSFGTPLAKMSGEQRDSDYNDWSTIFRDNNETLFVVSAGNDGKDTVDSPAYLAKDFPNVIAVGGTDIADKRANWFVGSSNYGEEITLVAPGAHVMTTCLPSLLSLGPSTGTLLDSRYTSAHSGTSLSVPFVAGAAALLKSIDSSLNASQIKEILVRTGDDIDWMNNGKTVKRLNLDRAVRDVYTAVSSISINGDTSVFRGNAIQLSATVSPSDATNKVLIWSSSNTGVATVDETGRVTGKGIGSATITATSKSDRSVKATRQITVEEPIVSHPVTGITINGASSVTVGSTTTLTVTITPADADNKAVSWSSSDTSKATVSSSGIVTGKSAGSVTITATAQDDSGVYGTKTITVSAVPPSTIPVTSISISGSSSVTVGNTISLSASVYPSTATNKGVSWSSSNPGRATVSSSGVVTGVSAGSVTITATAQDGSGAYGTKTITVSPNTVYVSSISISGSSSVYVGNTITLSASVYPSTATNKGVSWSSSNTGIATVSSSGVVTGKSAGSVTITATAQDGSGVYGTKTITVNSNTVYVTSISVSGSSSVYVGETISLSASVSPTTATNKAVSWSSSNTGVATVSSSGVVTGKSTGTVTITATAQDGSWVSGTKSITVSAKPASSYISDIKLGVAWKGFIWDSDSSVVTKAKNALIDAGYTVIDTDLNYNAWGQVSHCCIYLGYKTTTSSYSALTKIVSTYENSDSAATSKTIGGISYTGVGGIGSGTFSVLSANKGAHNAGSASDPTRVFLYTTTSSSAGSPISQIKVKVGTNAAESGWNRVMVTDGRVADMNKDADNPNGGDAPVITIYYK